MRVGWTFDDASLLLGEGKNSVCYSGSGKFGNDNDFDEYGASFAKDDVVSAFVDFTGDTVVFSFSKNGEDQVTCWFLLPGFQGWGRYFGNASGKGCIFCIYFGFQTMCHAGH